jgi:vitamin B12 transporter
MEQKTVRWHHYSRASYAVFQSLNKQITVGVLSLAMLASFDVKAATANGTADGIQNQGTPADEASVTQLDSVYVTTSRVPLTTSEAARMVTVLTASDLKHAAVHSINDLLKYATGADVRQRGDMGVQTDISLRGGTFDQITILLNGINICSPQTGHLSADFPVNTDDIERIEVLEGPAARLFGTSAFSGAINIVTKMASQSNVQAHLFGGQYGLGGGDAHLNISGKHVSQQLSGGYNRCDGAVDNGDFKQGKAFYQGQYNGDEANVDWMLGYSDQKYGANTFYSAAFPNQWEETERYLAAVRAETKGKLHLSPTLYWNRSYDHFQLVRDTHKGENFHRNDVYGLNLNSWVQWALGKTALGAEVRNEGILSTNLGRPMTDDSVKVHGEDDIYYKKKDNRTNISYYLEHDILLKKVTISLGLMANTNTALDEKFHLYPGIDMSYQPSSNWKFTTSWNKALRMPTWTDLYYKSPTQEGNVGLSPEEVSAFNLNARYRNNVMSVLVNGFFNHETDMIDWVMYNDSDVYHSTNFKLDNMGVEATVGIYFRQLWGETFPLEKFTASYAYIHQERDDDQPIFKSCYALEYLKHKVVFTLNGRIYGNLNASVAYRYQEREGGYLKYDANHKSTGQLVSYDPYSIVDLRLSYDAPHYTIYAEANNLFDKSYYDLGNVEQPGLWMKAGVKVNFDILKKTPKQTNE